MRHLNITIIQLGTALSHHCSDPAAAVGAAARYDGAHEHVQIIRVLLKEDADTSEACSMQVRSGSARGRRRRRRRRAPALTSAAVVMEREPSCDIACGWEAEGGGGKALFYHAPGP